jgi:formiminoglutamate deiminase
VTSSPSVFWAERVWQGATHDILCDVLVEVTGDTITSVVADAGGPPTGAFELRGLTIPGLVNAHSHAFHRALRGRTQADRGSFWTWRSTMYDVAERLTPENYERLATAVFAEMVLAGITTVGEFHYVHHRPGGAPHDDEIAMSRALVRAAATAGIRLTLLDTCYLAGGFTPEGDASGSVHVPLSQAQARFGDSSAAAWAARASASRDALTAPAVIIGAAVHSVRAVAADDLGVVASWAHEHDAPIHAHVSEQPAENADCVRLLGETPVEVLSRHGVLSRNATAVHATHLTPHDIELLAAGGAAACFCVTTERDLADGIGPAGALVDGGVDLTVGSDSHAVIDLFEELRGIEHGERVISNRRGHLSAPELLTAATSVGARSLGWNSGGSIAVGRLADFVTVSLDSVRLADATDESLLESVVFAATASDIRHVIVAGDIVVDDGAHIRITDVPDALREAINAVRPAAVRPVEAVQADARQEQAP